MANDTAWQEGFAIGSERGQEARAHKQVRSDEEFERKVNELISQRKNLLDKYNSTLDPNTNLPTDASYPIKAQLDSVNMDIRKIYHPDTSPGALSKFGHLLTNALHITKPQKAPSVTTQPTVAAPQTNNGSLSLPANPAYGQDISTSKRTQQPGTDATSVDLSDNSTDTMAFGNPSGLIKPGNLPIWNRPTVKNADGSQSSEYSVSFADDEGHEVLVPTVVDGKFLTPDGKKPEPGSLQEKAMFQAAWQHYLKTRQNLGVFDSPASADAYAEQLHNRGTRPGAIPAGPKTTVVGPSMSPEQKKKFGKNETRAQADTKRQIAGLPLSPEQAAIQQQQIENAAYTSEIQNKIDTVEKLLGRKLTPDERDRYVENVTGVMAQGATEVPQTFVGADGKQFVGQRGKDGRWYYLDGSPIPEDLILTAKMAPRPSVVKGLKFDAVTGQVVDPDNRKRYSRWDANLPPEVADMFASQKITEQEKQQRALQLSYERGTVYSETRPVQVIDPSDPTGQHVIYMPAKQAEQAGAGTPASIGFQTDKAITRYMTSGQGGTNITYFNTASDHLKMLQQAGNALGNGDIQVFNDWANRWANATGDPAPNDFNTVKAAVAGELSKTFKGTGATDEEIATIDQTINQAQSPDQIKGAIDYYIRLMNSKINAMKLQYQAGLQGKPAFDTPVSTPPNAPPSPTSNGYMYAKDPQGNLHKAKVGTALPQGWVLTNAPTPTK